MIQTTNSFVRLVIAGFVIVSHGSVCGQEWTPQPEQVLGKESGYSPYVDQHVPQQVFFGDTHPFPSTQDEFADFETWEFGNARIPHHAEGGQHAPV